MTACRPRLRLVALACLTLAAGCGSTGSETGAAGDIPRGSAEAPLALAYDVVAQTPHDTAAFTEGLVRVGDRFYESTGMEGRSDVRVVEAASGRILKRRALQDVEFGEGLALYRDRLYQLTWKNGNGHVYDAATLSPAGQWSYRGEGWGLTTLGDELVQSDGTATLRVLDPASRRVKRTIDVTLRGRPLTSLNELEYMGDGTVWANLWPTPGVAVIDLASGAVVATLDLSQLKARQAGAAETNGIARDAATGAVYVTGKYWNAVYEIRVHAASSR